MTGTIPNHPTSTNVAAIRAPESGGGYIAIELAQAFRRLGSTVVIIEHGRQLAAREDADVATAIQELFVEDGIV